MHPAGVNTGLILTKAANYTPKPYSLWGHSAVELDTSNAILDSDFEAGLTELWVQIWDKRRS